MTTCTERAKHPHVQAQARARTSEQNQVSSHECGPVPRRQVLVSSATNEDDQHASACARVVRALTRSSFTHKLLSLTKVSPSLQIAESRMFVCNHWIGRSVAAADLS
jgi:hypothetical protein